MIFCFKYYLSHSAFLEETQEAYSLLDIIITVKVISIECLHECIYPNRFRVEVIHTYFATFHFRSHICPTCVCADIRFRE